MSVMFERFFGTPQSFVRLGKIKGISGAASKLYTALCHESERWSTREVTRTVAELQLLVGGSRNSHAKARAELIQAGLVQAEPYGAEGFIFVLCDPATGEPWPYHPQERVKYRRKDGTFNADAQNAASPAKPKKPPKIDGAGTNFRFGANAAEVPSSVRQGTNQTPNESPIKITWEDIGATPGGTSRYAKRNY